MNASEQRKEAWERTIDFIKSLPKQPDMIFLGAFDPDYENSEITQLKLEYWGNNGWILIVAIEHVDVRSLTHDETIYTLMETYHNNIRVGRHIFSLNQKGTYDRDRMHSEFLKYLREHDD